MWHPTWIGDPLGIATAQSNLRNAVALRPNAVARILLLSDLRFPTSDLCPQFLAAQRLPSGPLPLPSCFCSPRLHAL